MELVHNHVADQAAGSIAQGHIGQDFSGAAEDGCPMIDGGVAGAQTNILGSKLFAQGQPLFIDQGLDGAGVDRGPSLGE